MQRIGVFVCHCGTNIAGTVDVKAVAEAMKREPGVVFATDYQYMCSQAGQNMIQDAVREHKLTGIVVCSCSPRMHEATFRKTAAAAGINSYMVEIANIREQCSWVHKDMPVGTEKAIILGKAAVVARAWPTSSPQRWLTLSTTKAVHSNARKICIRWQRPTAPSPISASDIRNKKVITTVSQDFINIEINNTSEYVTSRRPETKVYPKYRHHGAHRCRTAG